MTDLPTITTLLDQVYGGADQDDRDLIRRATTAAVLAQNAEPCRKEFGNTSVSAWAGCLRRKLFEQQQLTEMALENLPK